MNHSMRIPLAALLCASMSSAVADEKAQRYDIPAQPLHSALQKLADQAGVAVFFSENQVNGKTSPALNGQYSPREALQKLLAGSGLTYTFTAEDSVSIKATDQGSEVSTLPAVKVTGQAVDSNDPYNTDYNRTQSSTATKTDTPIMETPINVQVVPRAVIQDQQSVQIGDAIKNVSGVFQGFTCGGFCEEFMLRGFNTKYANYYDGLRFQAARIPLANAQSVEVVKGAAANLYGRIEPGGMINVITKRPQATPYYSLEQRFGSYDLYQTLGDATGAINKDGSLMYRINFENLNKNSFRDFGFTDRVFVAPSFTWKLSDRTKVDLDFMYSDEDTREDYGIVAVGTRPANIPRSRFLGEPSTDKSNTTLYNTGLTLTHEFNNDWKVRAKFNKLNRDTSDPQTYPAAGRGMNEQTGVLQRNFFGGIGNDDTYAGTVDVTGKFSTWDVKHNVLAGWDYYNYDFKFQGFDYRAAQTSTINIFDPQYNPVNLSQLPYNSFSGFTREWNGVYFQDQITLFDKLHILGGGRYDWASVKSGSSGTSLAAALASSTSLHNERFSPRVGLLYQPWQWLSLYGNYVESLGSPNSSIGVNGQILQPEIAEQYEVGFKTSFFNDRLISSVAFYDLTKQNLSVRIPGTIYSEAIGKARSQGVEIDISGRVTDGLSLIASYAYTDAAILKGNNQGKQLWNVPRNAGSFWAKYDLQQEALRGLSVGAGVYFQDQKQGDNANSYQLPGWGRVDALVKYSLPVAKTKTTFQFNIENLLDHEYYTATMNDRFSVNVGQPRTFMGSIKVEY